MVSEFADEDDDGGRTIPQLFIRLRAKADSARV
jgi:hypothetical protein